jgi:hypothetical protein
MNHPVQDNATQVDGWPKETGPLDTLDVLGILPRRGKRPTWLSYQKTLTSHTGVITYRCSTQELGNDALRAFAALSLENWAVNITTAPGTPEFRIRITAAITL